LSKQAQSGAMHGSHYNRMMSVMGIDYGGRRIGVAISESGLLASPHSVIENPGDEERLAQQLQNLGEQLGVDRFVIGLPRRTAPGQAGEEKFRRFADLLRQRTCREVVLWDETLSTVDANRAMHESGKNWKQRKALIDMEAAAVILQSYLDGQAPQHD